MGQMLSNPRANLKKGLASQGFSFQMRLEVLSMKALQASQAWQRLWRVLESPFAAPCWKDGPVFLSFGPDSPEGLWERSWEALLEALGKAHLQCQAPPEQMDHVWGF